MKKKKKKKKKKKHLLPNYSGGRART